MRMLALPLIAAASLSAAPAEKAEDEAAPPPSAASRPCDGTTPVFNPEGCPATPMTQKDIDEAVCNDTIHKVRDANGQPPLDKGLARPQEQEGYFIAAVDQRINGCSVMVMRNDTSDVRPLPKPSDHARIEPAG